MAQGVISNLRGGSFKSGFIGGVIGKASGVATNDIGGASPMGITLRTVTAAVFGGLASEATGGSFADGALSATLTHLFNYEGAAAYERGLYNENDGYHHYYEMLNEMCSFTQKGCTTDNVWAGLKRNPAPGWDNSQEVHTGDYTHIIFLGISGGTVSHIVYEKSMALINLTLPDHIFSNGYVKRSVVVKNNAIYIRSIGEGITSAGSFGPFPRSVRATLNMKLYKPGFDSLDNQIKDGIR